MTVIIVDMKSIEKQKSEFNAPTYNLTDKQIINKQAKSEQKIEYLQKSIEDLNKLQNAYQDVQIQINNLKNVDQQIDKQINEIVKSESNRNDQFKQIQSQQNSNLDRIKYLQQLNE